MRGFLLGGMLSLHDPKAPDADLFFAAAQMSESEIKNRAERFLRSIQGTNQKTLFHAFSLLAFRFLVEGKPGGVTLAMMRDLLAGVLMRGESPVKEECLFENDEQRVMQALGWVAKAAHDVDVEEARKSVAMARSVLASTMHERVFDLLKAVSGGAEDERGTGMEIQRPGLILKARIFIPEKVQERGLRGRPLRSEK
jgi:hypothetical protein